MESIINWMAQNWWALIKVVFVFGLIIFVHELGHFIAAKKVGVRVREFALGMGPKLFKFKKKETEYQLRLFPIGGFVNIEGEDEKCSDLADKGNFQNRTILERAFIIFNGCFMNYLAAILLFFIVATGWGIVTSSYVEPTTRIFKVIEGSPAYKAGLRAGDVITAIDGRVLIDGKEMLDIINKCANKKIILGVERDEKTFNVGVVPYLDRDSGEGKIGIFYDVVITGFEFEKVNLIGAVKFSLLKTYEITVAPVRVVIMLIKRELPARLVTETSAGPVGIMQMTFVLAKKGIAHILFFSAILNVAIGFFNLIPFPALDGSRIFFLAVEAVRRKPIGQEKEGMIHWVGLMILLLFVLLVTFQDILRILQGRTFFK